MKHCYDKKNTTISLDIEVPEALHDQIQGFLDENSLWNRNRLIEAAVALFLLQNPSSATAPEFLVESLIGSYPSDFYGLEAA